MYTDSFQSSSSHVQVQGEGTQPRLDVDACAMVQTVSSIWTGMEHLFTILYL